MVLVVCDLNIFIITEIWYFVLKSRFGSTSKELSCDWEEEEQWNVYLLFSSHP
jgi:hypothetical protein